MTTAPARSPDRREKGHAHEAARRTIQGDASFRSVRRVAPAPSPAAPRMITAPREDRRLLAIGLSMAGLLAFTGIDTCAKLLVTWGVPTSEVVFVRFFGHFLIMVFVAARLGPDVMRSASPGAELLRGLFLTGSTLFNFWALTYLPLTITASIAFTVPLWVCLLSVPLLGETLGPRRFGAILVGFSGVLLITRPWSGDMNWAVTLSILCAICASFYTIITRRLAGRDSTATQQFYTALIATLGTLPLAFAAWVWPADPLTWVLFGLIGFFGWLGHQFITIAYRYAGAVTIAPFSYVQIVFMTASSWIIFGDPPDGWIVAGALVVVASGLYIWLRERQLARRP